MPMKTDVKFFFAEIHLFKKTRNNVIVRKFYALSLAITRYILHNSGNPTHVHISYT